MEVKLWFGEYAQRSIARGDPISGDALSATTPSLDMSTEGWIAVGTYGVHWDEKAVKAACIEKTLSRLRDEETALRQELNRKLEALRVERESLLALEHTP